MSGLEPILFMLFLFAMVVLIIERDQHRDRRRNISLKDMNKDDRRRQSVMRSWKIENDDGYIVVPETKDESEK